MHRKHKLKRFLGPICQRITQYSARILMYHRFSRDSTERRLGAEAFEKQVLFLARYYKPCRMDELVARLQAGDRLSDRMVVITVDDGYADFFDVAYPILKRYGIPATIYVIKKFIDQTMWLWFDALRYCVNQGRQGAYTFDVSGSTCQIILSDYGSREIAWRKLAQACLSLTPGEIITALNKIERALGVEIPACPTAEFRAMTWDELRQLDLELIEVGSHTCSHPILSKCSISELEVELGTSKFVIEQEIGRVITSFCYPYGQPCDYDDRVKKAVQAAGYTNAVVAHGTLVDVQSDCFALERMGAPFSINEFQDVLDGYPHLRCKLRGLIK